MPFSMQGHMHFSARSYTHHSDKSNSCLVSCCSSVMYAGSSETHQLNRHQRSLTHIHTQQTDTWRLASGSVSTAQPSKSQQKPTAASSKHVQLPLCQCSHSSVPNALAAMGHQLCARCTDRQRAHTHSRPTLQRMRVKGRAHIEKQPHRTSHSPRCGKHTHKTS